MRQRRQDTPGARQADPDGDLRRESAQRRHRLGIGPIAISNEPEEELKIDEVIRILRESQDDRDEQEPGVNPRTPAGIRIS